MTDQKSDPVMGSPAPDFCLPDAEGEEYSLHDFAGKWLVLYFYPRDNTPGCTLEARGFSDAVEEFGGLDADIVGVSADSEASHQKFTAKLGLRFRILSDPKHAATAAYDVWKDRERRKGIERSTFLIAADGTIAAVWRKGKVPGHVEEVKKTLQKLRG